MIEIAEKLIDQPFAVLMLAGLLLAGKVIWYLVKYILDTHKKENDKLGEALENLQAFMSKFQMETSTEICEIRAECKIRAKNHENFNRVQGQMSHVELELEDVKDRLRRGGL